MRRVQRRSRCGTCSCLCLALAEDDGTQSSPSCRVEREGESARCVLRQVASSLGGARCVTAHEKLRTTRALLARLDEDVSCAAAATVAGCDQQASKLGRASGTDRTWAPSRCLSAASGTHTRSGGGRCWHLSVRGNALVSWSSRSTGAGLGGTHTARRRAGTGRMRGARRLASGRACARRV